ncbi:MAG: hypothetical protein D6711_19305, partial [Chloroflexi bacterium]
EAQKELERRRAELAAGSGLPVCQHPAPTAPSPTQGQPDPAPAAASSASHNYNYAMLARQHSPAPRASQHPDTDRPAIKTYPTLNAAFYANNPAAGRVWYLLRWLDPMGRGWLDLAEVKKRLTEGSERVYCGRRLRQILNKENGRLWDLTANGRIRYKSPAKVAAALDCGRFTGNPVDIPLHVFLGGIKQVRAHFYASYHSGRKENNPISRRTLRELTGVPESTQRVYDKVAGVTAVCNWSIENNTREHVENAAWKHGRGIFEFTDWQGKVGERGRKYLAVRLPNSYETTQAKSPKGRQKKINRAIDLVIKRARGIGSSVNRIYFPNGNAAVKAYNRNPEHDHYYKLALPDSKKPSKLTSGRLMLWDCIGAL